MPEKRGKILVVRGGAIGALRLRVPAPDSAWTRFWFRHPLGEPLTGADVDDLQPPVQLRGVQDPLVRLAIGDGEHGAQRLVAAHQLGKGGGQERRPQRAVEAHPDGTIVIVSHGGTIRWISAEALGA